MSAAEVSGLTAAGMALREGRITENEFLRRTDERWRRLAGVLYRRWRRQLPGWVGEDDVHVELQLLSLKFVREWSPEGGASLGSYVMWCARHRAQRALDKWRGASLHGNSGANESRCEVAASAAFDRAESGEEAEIGTRVPVGFEEPFDLDAEQEGDAAFDDLLRRCRTTRQALVLIALRATDGDPRRAGPSLYRQARSRMECGMRSERHSVGVVLRTLREIEGLAREARRDGERQLPADLFVDESAA